MAPFLPHANRSASPRGGNKRFIPRALWTDFRTSVVVLLRVFRLGLNRVLLSKDMVTFACRLWGVLDKHVAGNFMTSAFDGGTVLEKMFSFSIVFDGVGFYLRSIPITHNDTQSIRDLLEHIATEVPPPIQPAL